MGARGAWSGEWERGAGGGWRGEWERGAGGGGSGEWERGAGGAGGAGEPHAEVRGVSLASSAMWWLCPLETPTSQRSEERRVGKEPKTRGSQERQKEKRYAGRGVGRTDEKRVAMKPGRRWPR